jgi:signal transduction histidine kinase
VENRQFNKTDSVRIADSVNEVYQELEDRLEDKRIVFNNNIAHTWVMQGNRTLMHTLLFNIINNAIKYNREDGSITLTDEILMNQYTLHITDTGIGMDEQQIEKAFNRFEKLDTDEKESYGLGLAIVKSITAFHQIVVKIQSGKDTGTTVKLIFGKNEFLH